jgi:methylase of polypeptide subunit release factors
MTALPNRLQRVRETQADRWLFRYANGLLVQTDPFMRADPARVLPVGGPQDMIMNRLACMPELVVNKSVFDPFAGSGVLGLMALRLGAAHVDFLDVSPRAQRFQVENAQRNGFASTRYRTLLRAIAEFEPEAPYDLVLANPPFVPTPDGVEGTLTSSGGRCGDRYVRELLERLDRCLTPAGEAYLYLMQLVWHDEPLIASAAVSCVVERSIELTAVQEAPAPLQSYVAAYQRCFPDHGADIERWARELRAEHSDSLAVQHYVMHVQARRPGPTSFEVSRNLAEKYGAMMVPQAANDELALGRVMENVVPKPH